MENLNNMTVNELLALKNRIEGEVAARIEKATEANTAALIAAVKNLIMGVGQGFRSEDYYAPSRYYLCKEDGTEISGVKNIRFYKNHDDETIVCVKLTAESGKLIPDTVKINDAEEYKVGFEYSRNYDETCNY